MSGNLWSEFETFWDRNEIKKRVKDIKNYMKIQIKPMILLHGLMKKTN